MYVIAIPSYGRAELCKQKTIHMLSTNQIDLALIHIYVVAEEYQLYKSILPEYSIIVGEKGLVQQREFILRQFHEGKHIVFLDDDIQSVDLSLTEFCSLNGFFNEAFEITEKKHAYLWGVYPVYNQFFRRIDIDTRLNYIVGAFFGMINRHAPDLKLHITTNGQKEDVERSILYYKKDGVVVRFGRVGFVTKYYGKEGGLGTFKSRLELMREASIRLKEEYPEYGKVITKKTGMTEFRLHKRREKDNTIFGPR